MTEVLNARAWTLVCAKCEKVCRYTSANNFAACKLCRSCYDKYLVCEVLYCFNIAEWRVSGRKTIDGGESVYMYACGAHKEDACDIVKERCRFVDAQVQDDPTFNPSTARVRAYNTSSDCNAEFE